MKIDSTTLVGQIVSPMALSDACTEGLDYCTKYSDMTLEDALNHVKDDSQWESSWGMWWLRLFGDEASESVVLGIIRTIKDPMMAFMLYLKLPWLTNNIDRALEDLFRGKLPRAEEELRIGKVRRAKWR